MNNKYIALVDGNNFFASCEQMANPNLKGKPVCVLSNNDGCVIARSYEAKALGIPMGIPYFMAKNKFKDVIYLSSNFTLYHEISTRMMQLLHNYTDTIEVYSIDEAFLDITGMDKVLNISYKDFILKIRNEIEDKIGIVASVGLAPSKILAKLANHKAKKGNGAYQIEKHLIENEIEYIPIDEIWGIGKNIARTLRKYGIFYAHEIPFKEDNFYKTILGKKGLELKYELMGYSVIPFFEAEKPKSIQKTRAFPEFSQNENYIKTEIGIHLQNVCRKLRNYGLETNRIAIMLRTKDFKVYFNELKLNYSTSSEIDLIPVVEKLFNELYRKNIIYRSSGVHVYELENKEKKQLNLFINEEKEVNSVVKYYWK